MTKKSVKEWRRRAIGSFVLSAALLAFVALTAYLDEVLKTHDWKSGLAVPSPELIVSIIIAVLIVAFVIFLLSILWPYVYDMLVGMMGASKISREQEPDHG